MKRILIVLACVLLIVAAAGAVWFNQSRDETTSVNSARAAELADAQQSANDANIDPGERPDAGTWKYTGSGTEHLSLLGGSTHDFPTTIYAVVKLDANDACAWTFDLVFIEEHIETHEYCTNDAGLAVSSFERTTTFLGREQTSSYTCDAPAYRWKRDAKPGVSWTWSCTEARGGIVRYTGTLVGVETLKIDGTSMPTQHVRVVARQQDKSTGRERSDWWYLESGLPARMQSNRTLSTDAGPLGTLTTTERFAYTLDSATPRTASK